MTDENADPSADKTDGMWFAGNLVKQRVAPINNRTGKGSGSYETCGIDRISEVDDDSDYKKGDPRYGKRFDCCKTAYRPYDLVVTAVLIALKNHFGEDVYIDTDGEEKDWMDGRFLCNNLLGYGLETKLDFEKEDEKK